MSYQYFSDRELSCPCCGEQKMDEGFMHVLEAMRGMCDFKWPVTSGYRCENHDRRVSSGTGAHTTGKAIDIAVSRGEAFRILQMLGSYPITGVGVRQHGNRRFIHLDMITDDESPYEGKEFLRPTVWSYK